MPKGTKILTDVPEGERKTIIEGFEGEGAKVTCKEEPEGSGKFKITAEFPDSDAEDNQTTSSSSTADKKNPGAAKMVTWPPLQSQARLLRPQRR